MVENKQIFIHAGAHRTGTSSFQMCLSVNRDVLEADGYDLAYPGRDGAPKGKLALRLPRPHFGPRKLAQAAQKVALTIADHRTQADRALILSEENIPGPMKHFREGKFYPGAAKRMDVLHQGLGGRPAHLLLVVRDYAALFQSGYRKRAEDNACEPFADLVPAYMDVSTGWAELVREMSDRLQPQRFTVLRYENRGSSCDLLRRLVPELADADLQEPDRMVNLSATDAALEALQARYHAGQDLSRPQWQQVIMDHAEQTDDRGFAQFSPSDRAILNDRYAADLEKLSKMDAITLV